MCYLSSQQLARLQTRAVDGNLARGRQEFRSAASSCNTGFGPLPRTCSAPGPRGRPGSAWRSAGTHPSTRPSPRAAASRLRSEQPRAGGRGPPGPWARSPPGRLRAAAAGAAGLPPARVTCAERGSPASPPRPRRSGDAGAPEADTAARSPARPRRPPPPPPPARTNSRRRTGTGGAAGLPGGRAPAEGPHWCLGGTSGERLPAGPRLRLGAVSGASSVALPPICALMVSPAGAPRAGGGGRGGAGRGWRGRGGAPVRNGEKQTERNGPAQPREETSERGSHPCL